MLKLLEPDEPRPMTKEECAMLEDCYRVVLAKCRRVKEKQKETEACPVSVSALGNLAAIGPLIQWMLYQGHVEHCRQLPRGRAGNNRWQPIDSALFNASSAIVLTGKGEAFAENFLRMIASANGKARAAARKTLTTGRLVPTYDQDNRVFRWGYHVLKHFLQPADVQEHLLIEFQRSHWAAWLHNPLPRVTGTNPKARTHDAIKRLNRNQSKPLIHFKGDGSGIGVGWELR